jgi:hypothetical protein
LTIERVLNPPIIQQVDRFAPNATAVRSCCCDNSRVELYPRCVIISLGKSGIKNTNADQRRHEEEQMGLSPLALTVVMALIGISIPLLVFAGCIMTAKKKPEAAAEAAPHLEFDRAA